MLLMPYGAGGVSAVVASGTRDGKPLQAGISVELEIFRDTRGYGGVRRQTSYMKAEVQPLNTGS